MFGGIAAEAGRLCPVSVVSVMGRRRLAVPQRMASKYAEGMSHLAEQWPYLRYLGLGAWWAWIWLCYTGTGLYAFWPDDALFARQVGSMYLCSTPAIMCTLLLAAAFWRKVTPLMSRRHFVVAVSCLGVLGSLLIAFAPMAPGFPMFELGALLTGIGTSILALKTGEVYGTLGGREVLTAGSISLMFTAFLFFMGSGIPLTWQPFFIAALPLVSALLYIMPGDDPFPADELLVAREHGGRRAPGMRSFVRLVLAAALVAVTAGFARGIACASMPDDGFAQTGAVTAFAVFMASLAICFMINTGDLVRAVRRVYAMLVVLGVAVIFASAFGVNLICLGIGKELLWMMFTCLMAYTAFRFGFSPVRAFGIGQAVYLGASAASWGLGISCAHLFDSPSAHLVVTAALMFAIVALFAFVFTDADIKFIFTWKRDGSVAAQGRGEDQMSVAGGFVAGRGGAFAVHGEAACADVGSMHAPHQAGYSVSAAAGLPCDARLGNAVGAVGSSCAARSDGATAGALLDPESLALNLDALEACIAAIPENVGISAREAQIMSLFAQGRSANWIAEDLIISKNTVRSHIRSIYTKLDVHSRKELLEKLARG